MRIDVIIKKYVSFFRVFIGLKYFRKAFQRLLCVVAGINLLITMKPIITQARAADDVSWKIRMAHAARPKLMFAFPDRYSVENCEYCCSIYRYL